MTIVSSVEWLQSALNAKHLAEVSRRVAELETALTGEIRAIRQELTLLRALAEDDRA